MAAATFMLDTDTLVFVVRGLRQQQRAHASRAERILARIRSAQAAGAAVGVSAVTVSELEYGTCRSAQPVTERRAVAKILAPFELFDYDAVSAPRHYGEIRAHLEAAGVPIGAMDLLIAAHARALGATLVTHNTAEFTRIEGLRCENWTEPAARAKPT
jgi:tRNA(fMet)-specific endonuclease VapC